MGRMPPETIPVKNQKQASLRYQTQKFRMKNLLKSKEMRGNRN